MAIEFSYVVPVYNVRDYLRLCVESLLGQDLERDEYEIILIDDGSTDGSGDLCDEFAARETSIRVIHQANRGLSAARNVGTDIARGKYIQYVDSDDFLEADVLRTLVEIARRDCLDVLRFNYRNVNEHGDIVQVYKNPGQFSDYSESVTDGKSFLVNRLGFACYACQFIIRREMLKDCMFKEGIYFEDTEWTPRMLMKAKRVASTPMLTYNYRVRHGSITRSMDKEKKSKVLEDRLGLIDSLNEQKQSVEDKRWFDGMISHTSLTIISEISSGFYESRRDYISKLQSKGVFPLSTFHATATATRKILLANISPMLLCFLLHSKHKRK